MRYVIGDIHGEYNKLTNLIMHIDKNASQYIFLGDFVDKGKNSKEVINFLIDLSCKKRCVFLMGDHEYAWLKYFQGEERFLDFLLKYGGVATIKSYLNKKLVTEEARSMLVDKKSCHKILKDLIVFCKILKFYYEIDENYLCVHAGINPKNKGLPLDLHDKEQLVFIRDEFIDSQFLYKGRRIIFAHTTNSEPYVDDYKIGIDTGASCKDAGYGNLTAFNIDRKEFVNQRGEIKTLICR